jgi:hypothetical protein
VQASGRGSAVAAGVIALAIAASLSTRPAAATGTRACVHAPGPTTLIIDGNLYAVVRAAQRRYLFGASGRPVLSMPEALRLVRRLGFTGTDAQLFRRLEREGIPGAGYADAGSISNFTFGCQGTYTATAVVRTDRGAITATRFWLQQGGTLHVTRAFCMPEQWVPVGARVSVTFRVPLAAAAPVFAIDWDANGKVDSVGPFRAGGTRFPARDRC